MEDDYVTGRLALPLLASGQAGKELTHNEALTLIDIALQPVVEAVGVEAPPAAPVAGMCWVTGAAPTGAWAGRAHVLAGWTAGGWRFVAPRAGFAVHDLATARAWRFDGETWVDGVAAVSRVEVDGLRVVGAREPAIAAPASGSVVDSQARAALGSILSALRAHGLIAG